ncbi:hypothetical protein BLA29_012739 [Euroglyphus maynei]|uniref:Uncharacterized protein n=1 Tax=Euroglyphus maynei TaxID=6958 RepID=A0A1Y3B1V6_EURMA|nr:hypothetical protein BLA29_012739 [Euroglyphus maynei]
MLHWVMLSLLVNVGH